MNKNLKVVAFVLTLMAAVVVAFGAGYYRGYHRASHAACAFGLVVNESIYGDLERGNLKKAQDLAGLEILSESEFLRFMEKSPFHSFLYQVSHSRIGDTAKSLQKADEVIATDNLKTKTAKAIPSSE